jgi:hypothetical protein
MDFSWFEETIITSSRFFDLGDVVICGSLSPTRETMMLWRLTTSEENNN